ncbi:MAG: carbohydrate ABC transporter substrate-binding protein [Lachnospiraceae bacterium]|nr:carbohydrate ABC transporter substrate-binding protein [Lachnospiraceae bacterium]
MKEYRRQRIAMLILIILIVAGSVAIIVKLDEAKVNTVSVTDRQDEVRIRMSWWGNDGRHKYTMEGVDVFHMKNPGIAVDYRYGEWNGYEKRTKVWMESHTETDVMQINYAWLDQYSPDGNGFYDLNKLADYIDLDNFTEEEKSYGMKNGKLNALPIAMNSHTFYYNQDVLDKYGLKVPETWDDLLNMGKAMAPDGKYVLGMSKKQMFLLLLSYYEQTYGKQMFSQDGGLVIDEEGMTFILDFYKRMIDEHVSCPIELFERSKYMSGEIAGAMCWISDTKIYCDGLAETGAKVVRASYPKLNGSKLSGWYIKPATMWAISADTVHPEEAAKLLDYLLNDPDMVKLQQTEKGVPVSSAAIKTLSEEGLSETNEYKATMELNKNIESLNLMIPNMENEKIIDAFKVGADEYIFDKQSVEECARNTLDAMKKAISGEK